jgi:DNA-binding IclR family transcriptional regulator
MTQRKANRLNEMLACLGRGGQAGMSRKEMAECLGLKVSPHLVAMLDILIDHGYARKALDESVYPPAWKYYMIEVVP